MKHPSYVSSTQMNDAAVLILSSDVTLNNYIQVTCLPRASSTTYPTSNQNSWVYIAFILHLMIKYVMNGLNFLHYYQSNYID